MRMGPFRGEFSASLWNAQAFFCVDQSRFAAKVAYAKSLLDRADMLLLNEAQAQMAATKLGDHPLAPLPGGLLGLLLRTLGLASS